MIVAGDPFIRVTSNATTRVERFELECGISFTTDVANFTDAFLLLVVAINHTPTGESARSQISNSNSQIAVPPR